MILFFHYIAKSALFQEDFRKIFFFVAINEWMNPIGQRNALFRSKLKQPYQNPIDRSIISLRMDAVS